MTLRQRVLRSLRSYDDRSPGDRQPLAGYAALMTVYGGLAGAIAGAAWLTGRRPPKIGAGDVALLSTATFMASRLVTKDAVTSPLRAPLTAFDGPAGASEVNEHVTATGPAHALGELVTCPFCVSVWISTALCGGLVLAPRLTRLIAGGLTAVAASDFLQLAYDAAKTATGEAGS